MIDLHVHSTASDIEAHYHDFTPAERQELVAIAHDLHLLITAGSDFHGSNKPTIRLGMEVGDEEGVVGRLSTFNQMHLL